MAQLATEKKMVPTTGGNSNRTFIKLGELTPAQIDKGIYLALSAGDSLSGVLQGSEEGLFGKTNYTIRTSDGDVVISGAGNLNYKLAPVAVGTYVEIIYKGKTEIKKGAYAGKQSHTFEVLQEKI